MLLPEIWGLFAYWSENPTAAMILRALHVERKDRDGGVSGTEAMVLNSLGNQGRPASVAALPHAVQAAIEQMRTTNG